MLFNIYTYQFKPIYQTRTLFCDPDLEAEKAMKSKNLVFAKAIKESIFIYPLIPQHFDLTLFISS